MPNCILHFTQTKVHLPNAACLTVWKSFLRVRPYLAADTLFKRCRAFLRSSKVKDAPLPLGAGRMQTAGNHDPDSGPFGRL